MNASRERWMLFCTFILTVLFVCFFILPNYKSSQYASKGALELEARVAQLERRQVEVEQIYADFLFMESQVVAECKLVPDSPDTAEIVRALSLEVDGHHVLDQSFTAGATSSKLQQENGFIIQPLAVTLHADFDAIFSVVQNVESMNRLIRISSLRISSSESDSASESPVLEASIGLHAMYDDGDFSK
jgi:Tfp pilus assembly protein PilO